MGGATPKALIPVNGKPLIRHIMDMWKTSIDEFIFVVGYKWEEVTGSLPKKSVFVIQEHQKGIADAIYATKGVLGSEDNFVVVLGDCLQVGEWIIPPSLELGVGVWETSNRDAIRQSYSVEVKEGYVSQVVEKPKSPPNEYCGMGTYFFDSRVFRYIKRTPLSPLRNEREITDTIQLMINAGEKITPVVFKGEYLNITYPGDIEKAERLLSGKEK